MCLCVCLCASENSIRQISWFVLLLMLMSRVFSLMLMLVLTCKIRTGILARFWPPGFFFPAGISPGSRQDSRRETKFLAAKISPGSCRESRQDSRREEKIPAAKISARSCRESYQDSRREAIIPAAKISPECYRESRQDSRRGAKI